MDSIGKRLKAFAIEKYGSVSALAEHLQIKPQSLFSYIYDKAKPADKMQERLRQSGCDVEWLMTGIKSNSGNTEELTKLVEEKDIYIRLLTSENEFLREQVEIYKSALEIRSAKPIEEVVKDLEIRFQDPTNPLGWLSKFKDMGEPEEPEEELRKV